LDAAARFDRYLALLLERNAQFNLTAIREPDEIRRRHFADSLELLKVCDFTAKRVADVGSGAGFPGLPLKIAEPSLELTLVEATGKKCAFLREVCDTLGLEGVTVLHARAEELGHGPLRERFDIAVSRGVARFSALAELCLPLVRVGGTFLAMKSDAAERAAAEGQLRALGGQPGGLRQYALPGGKQHCVFITQKYEPTPARYPRAWGQIKKEMIP
jgi:16S rRNA (guanine527-N7)-methyltransferase